MRMRCGEGGKKRCDGEKKSYSEINDLIKNG